MLTYYYLVMQGCRGRQLFREARDYRAFVRCMAGAADTFDCSIYAFCLIERNARLVMSASDGEIDNFIAFLTRSYRGRIHWAHEDEARVFGPRRLKRFHHQLLPFAIRAVHEVPVRAGLSASAKDWSWSSCRAYAKKGRMKWLTQGPEFQPLPDLLSALKSGEGVSFSPALPSV